ncbi:MAG: HDIG domain-containing protein [Bacteroidetes bacterium]|nr:HDIG domain-containing protein [Bacteroidota bacterium]
MNNIFKLKHKKLQDTDIIDNYLGTQDKKRYSLSVKIIIIVLSILFCSFFSIFSIVSDSNRTGNVRLEPGTIWTSPTLKADYNFSVYKSDMRYNAEVQNAKDSVQQIFILDAFAEQNTIECISALIQQLSIDIDNNFLLDYVSNEKLQNFNKLNNDIKKKEINKINSNLVSYIKLIYKRGLINTSVDKIMSNDIITVKPAPNQEYYLDKNSLFDRQLLSINTQIFLSNLFNPATGELLSELLYKVIQPNLIYSEELTERSMNLAANSVKRTIAFVHKDEIIVKKGTRLDENTIQKIKSYYVNLDYVREQEYSFLYIVGNIGHICIIFSLLILYLLFLRREIWHDNYKLLMLFIPLVLIAAFGWASYQYELIDSRMPMEYLILLPACSMFIAIVFDVRIAFYTTVAMVLLLSGVRGNDYYVGAIMIFTGTIASYSVHKIEDKNQIFRSIVFIFIGFVFSIIVISWERGFEFAQIMPHLLFALINAIASAMVTFFTIFLLNKFLYYSITTNIKLKEYDDEDNPVLLEMKTKAPGTFEHSRTVASLAQKCAEAINIDSLLVKVGALYHDIGKIEKAEYFTENKEKYNSNLHSALTPKESAAIIKSHVTNGIELALKIKLPKPMIDFIPMHHGTSLIKHFYNVAVNNAKENNTVVDEKDFRYSGPKPQTKETALLMICDSAEAISKSVNDINEYYKLLNAIIDDRITDGQFNECDITLKEICIIRDVIISEIQGKLHTRTRYATIKDENNLEGKKEEDNNQNEKKEIESDKK